MNKFGNLARNFSLYILPYALTDILGRCALTLFNVTPVFMQDEPTCNRLDKYQCRVL